MQEAASRIAQLAEDLRVRADGIKDEVTPEPQVPQPEVDPTPVTVPEPEPPREPEPGPVPVPEPTPEPVPEPTPDPIPLPEQPDQPPAAESVNGDESGARLVAMKMALDGASRKQIEQHLAETYGSPTRASCSTTSSAAPASRASAGGRLERPGPAASRAPRVGAPCPATRTRRRCRRDR